VRSRAGLAGAGDATAAYEFGRLPWFADFLRRVALLLVRLDMASSVSFRVVARVSLTRHHF
jgi:hypothetical protein